MAPRKALKKDENTFYSTATETFHTRTTDTRAMIPQVLNRFSPPQNYRRSVLGEHGITRPCTRIKQAESRALQGVRSRDLTGTYLKGTHTQGLRSVRTRVLVGTCGAHAKDTVGACTRIQAHARDKGTILGIVWSKIPMLEIPIKN